MFILAALALQLLDPREVAIADPATILARAVELRDAPRAEEADRFVVTRDAITSLIAMNRQLLAHYEKCENLYPGHYASAIRDTKLLYRAWDELRDAKCDYYYVTVRRASLKKLRDLIGEDAWSRGIMPPHVPYWHMTEVRP